MNPHSSRSLGIVRFLSLLSLAVWVGGLAMIGLAAPAIFKLNRLLGPRVVAAMLERFSPVSMVCGVVLMGCWLWEWRQSSTRSTTRSNRSLRVQALRVQALRVQGICTFAMLLLGSYLALVAEPRIRTLQPPLQQTVLKSDVASSNGTSSVNATEVIVKAGPFTSLQAHAEFRKLHGVYGGLTSLIVLLGVVVLAIIATPSAAPIEYSIGEEAAAKSQHLDQEVSAV
jgi:putative copper export protein